MIAASLSFTWNAALCIAITLGIAASVYAETSREAIEKWTARSIANRESLNEFVCEFQVRVGLTPDPDSCDITTAFATGSGSWARRGGEQTLAFIPERSDQIDYGGGFYGFPIRGRDVVIQSQSYQFNLSPITAAKIRERSDQHLISDYCPFSSVNFNGSDPLYNLLNFLELEGATFDALTLPNGNEVAIFYSQMNIGDESLVNSRSQITFDPAKNYLITEVALEIGEDSSHFWRVIDSVESPEGSYFPREICMTAGKCKKGKLLHHWLATNVVFEEPTDEQLDVSVHRRHNGSWRKI